jgi:hypothetical protein
MKSLLAKPVYTGETVGGKGGSADLVAVAERGMATAVTPMNPTDVSGMFRVPPPKLGLMTASQLGRLQATARQVSEGSKNAEAGLALARQINDDMTKVKLAHDKTIAHYAKNDLKQLQSQHAVAGLLETLRPEYMNMSHTLAEQRTHADGYQAGFNRFQAQAQDLMALAG